MIKSPAFSRVAIFCALAGFALPVAAGTDMFLKLENLQGESRDYAHSNEVDVLSWSWNLSKTPPSGGSGNTNIASFGRVSLVKFIDSASPGILQACGNGKALGDALLTLRSASPHPRVYCTYSLTNVTVTSEATGGSGGEDRLTETVGLDFAGMTISYTPVLNPLYQAFLFDWDIPGNSGQFSTLNLTAPRPVDGLACSLSYTAGSPFATLGWKSSAGLFYQVWSAADAAGPFAPYGRPMTSFANGPMTLTVPANSVGKFFRVESLWPQ
ncbi:MAG TPA: type VI secretion system tube protein Hcp [Verrucomicrobiae bacterium]|nr:type VI secretion system tube protein Hcp [Verrucomicrobiae bacterium]